MEISSENYITIQGWMRTELNLKGNDLLVYAIIYGFSQDNNSKFIGGLSYLANWCGATKQGIQNNLKHLLDKQLIIKEEVKINGIKYSQYSCTVYNKVEPGIQQSCTNNIIDNYISNDILDTNKDNTNTKVLVEKFEKFHRPNKYESCLREIDNFTNNPELKNILKLYLNMRLEIKDKQLYRNQWKGLLNKLNKLTNDEIEMAAIVQQSLDKGYASFYPVNKKSVNNSPWNDKVSSTGYTAEELEELSKQEERLRANGIKTRF